MLKGYQGGQTMNLCRGAKANLETQTLKRQGKVCLLNMMRFEFEVGRDLYHTKSVRPEYSVASEAGCLFRLPCLLSSQSITICTSEKPWMVTNSTPLAPVGLNRQSICLVPIDLDFCDRTPKVRWPAILRVGPNQSSGGCFLWGCSEHSVLAIGTRVGRFW